ncbi:probable WRKY transcription factor 7 [Juglans microcarpa x Juglans regia]|uniref:probable WRKY transcription factor 7 n=1 Tax=Juglans microcarpa x Juglans regia TaxID=2249226 RepID=UPI001B7E9851|nr:probable WRKY transcription factor 7 [Juglans microcarpa x Juglans regia]
MAMKFMEYRNNNSSNNDFRTKMEENAMQEAASGLESVEKLIRLLSQQSQQQHQYQSLSSSSLKPSLEMEMDCKDVADVVVSKFKKVITLLDQARTGHARFRRAPLANSQSQEKEKPSASAPNKVYYATSIQQIPPLPHHNLNNQYQYNDSLMPKKISAIKKGQTQTLQNDGANAQFH